MQRPRDSFPGSHFITMEEVKMMETFTCDHRGVEFPIVAQTLFDEQVLCETCLDELTAVCDHCGERI